MSEHARDPSEDLAEWLTDVGRRTWRRAPQSGTNLNDGAAERGEVLFRYLEELAGRKFRTREDIRRYLGELSAQGREAGRIHRRRQVVKDTVMLMCLLASYIQYNFLDVNLQIARLPATVVFVPVETGNAPARGSHNA
jgi:hypothetical protein